MKIVNDSRDLLIHTHMGLGDHLVLSGMIRKIAESNDDKKIFLITRDDIHDNVELLYSDIEQIIPTNISFYPKLGQMYNLSDLDSPWRTTARTYAEMMDLNLVTIGYHNHRGMYFWDQSFYDSMEIDYNVKYEYFKIPENILEASEQKYQTHFLNLVDNKEFVFLHDDPKRNYKIDGPIETELQIVRNNKLVEENYSIFDMIPVLKKAKQLHMIGSSLLCLCDLLNLPTNEEQKCFYYASMRGFGGWPGVNKWKLL